jgi:hypothetical protein
MVKRDVRFEEEKSLRKAHDTSVAAGGDQEMDTQKTKAVQGIGVGMNGHTRY